MELAISTTQRCNGFGDGTGIGESHGALAPGRAGTVPRPAQILVVEDEQIVALELRDRLVRMGHAVPATVATAEEAVEYAERLRPELVLMDIKLRGEMDGIAAAELIQRKLDIPIVYITAFADDQTVKRAKATEPHGYLLKPFQERELHVVIEMAIHRHEMVRQLREAEDAAQRAVKVRDNMLAIVSHDLRNLLSSVSLRAEQLVEYPEEISRDRVLKHAEGIQRNVVRMKRFIDDLLDVARIDSGHLSIARKSHQVAELLAEIASSFEIAASRRSVTLNIANPVLPIAVLCDRDRILQVLSNLVENALKFSADRARIHVTTQISGQMVQFQVSDEAGGIADEQIQYIFDQYWQAPRARRKGAGLGLYIAKGIVEAHGGQLWVKSCVGAGSTFFFTLPMAGEAASVDP